MNGGRTVTDDTCLYAEALALRTAQESQSQVLLQNQLTLGLRYYFGAAPLPVSCLAGSLDRNAICIVAVCCRVPSTRLWHCWHAVVTLVVNRVSPLHCRCTWWLA